MEHYSKLFAGKIQVINSLTFKVPARSTECMFQELNQFDTVAIELEVRIRVNIKVNLNCYLTSGGTRHNRVSV